MNYLHFLGIYMQLNSFLNIFLYSKYLSSE